jgi:hypothetical protein
MWVYGRKVYFRSDTCIETILEKTHEHRVSTYHLFIDFKAAYDRTDRDKLFEAMEELQIPKKLINLTKATLKTAWCRVKVNNELSEPFKTRNRLRQGVALSCMLFNIALEKAVRASGTEKRGTIYHKSVQILAYADDIDIIGRSERVVREAFKNVRKNCTRDGTTGKRRKN